MEAKLQAPGQADAAVRADGGALKYLPKNLRCDPDIVLAAVESEVQHWTGNALKYADPHRLSGEIVLAAVRRDGLALKYARKEFKSGRYREIALAAVTQNGHALQHVCAALKSDREVVLAAVTHNGAALKHAAELLKIDRGVVLRAVGQDGCALQYAQNSLDMDREVVITAVSQTAWALQFVAEALQHDEHVLSAVAKHGNYGDFCAWMESINAPAVSDVHDTQFYRFTQLLSRGILPALRQVSLFFCFAQQCACQLSQIALHVDTQTDHFVSRLHCSYLL